MPQSQALLVRLGRLLGVNRAVVLAIAARAWPALAGPVTIILIATNFSPLQQGYFYTFSSLLALQVFFELGLAFVIVQVAAHKFVHVRWEADGGLSGDSDSISKFLGLIGYAIKWYFAAGIGMAILVLPLGLVFFATGESATAITFSWRAAWCLAVIALAASLPLVPILAAIEGSGRVRDIYALRLQQGILASAATWFGLIAGGGLFVVALNIIVSAVVGYLWLHRSQRKLVSALAPRLSLHGQTEGYARQFSWRDEVWPLQWRIAVSWISGYLISQLFTPILFRYHGPEIAGRMGMTMAFAGIITNIGMAWLSASTPALSRLAATRNWRELDTTYRRIFLQSTSVIVVGSVIMISATWLQPGHFLMNRLLPADETAILFCAYLVSHVIGALAHYLRVHKREPFTALSVMGAVLMCLVLWQFGKEYASYGMVVGLLMVHLFYGLPTALWLWTKLRRAWHS